MSASSVHRNCPTQTKLTTVWDWSCYPCSYVRRLPLHLCAAAVYTSLPAASQKTSLLDVRLVLSRLEVIAGNEVRDVVIVLVVVLLASLTLLLLHTLVALGEFAQRCERVGAELVEDTGDELGELLVLTGAVDGEGVGRYRGVDCTWYVSSCPPCLFGMDRVARLEMQQRLSCLHTNACAVAPTPSCGMGVPGPTLWCREVNDIAVALEHVDLLNSLDGLDVQLLKRSLELLVVGTSGPVDLLDLPAGCALSTIAQLASCFIVSVSSAFILGAEDVRLEIFGVLQLYMRGGQNSRKRSAYPTQSC